MVLAMTTITHAPPSGALAQLVAAIRHAVGSGGDWADTADRVAAALDGRLPTAADLAGAETHNVHVEPDGSFSILAIAWRPQQWTRVHDHVTWCVFAALEGEVVEEQFRLDEAAQTLLHAGRRELPPGTISGEAPPGDIHRLGNPHAATAITLHVYGTDITRLGSSVRRTYDLPISG
jgi:predicted metal-dependent enzyme (double-stranded beta helix superfamily)